MNIRPAATTKAKGTTFYVTSASGTEYIVHNKRNAVSHRKMWTCNCPDYTERRQFNNTLCKHIDAVRTNEANVPSVKEVLTQVVKVLNGLDGKQLWDILTALRGPDNENTLMKRATTAEIRGALGIESDQTGAVISHNGALGAESLSGGALGAESLSRDDIIEKVFVSFGLEQSPHFVGHYASAVMALKRLGYIK